jgi:hypothetical protein
MTANVNDDTLNEMTREYEPLLCQACKDRLRAVAEPLRDKLEGGRAISPRHVKKLLLALCPSCLDKIIRKKSRE